MANVMNRPKVVILGAGFAGLNAARALSGEKCEVLLVDRENYHTFQPLLYQVAAAELEPAQIAYPVRGILQGCRNVDFALAEVRDVDFENKVVHTHGPDIEYDYLVIALGSTTNVFDTPGAMEYAFFLKTVDQAISIRNHIMACFERAALITDPAVRKRLLTFTVVGGGPAGVEYAGALAELIRGPIRRDFPSLSMSEASVTLLQSGESVLPVFDKKLRLYTKNRLEKMGVDVRLNARVSEITEDCVRTKEGCVIQTETVIWTAGVKARDVVDGVSRGWAGRILIDEFLQSVDHKDVFVIGDQAVCKEEGCEVPQLASAAIQQGRHVARNIGLRLMERPPLKFNYHDKGIMAVIGRNSAVAQTGSCYSGFVAWSLWLSVHLLFLIGFRNKLMVLIDWGRDYFFGDKGVRLIVPRSPGDPATNTRFWKNECIARFEDDE